MALTPDDPLAAARAVEPMRAARLRRLSIRDLVLVDALDIDFALGLNVLTGETGAGKSILLDALGLTLGAKADAGLVRAGAKRASAAAAFLAPPDHPAAQRLAALDLIEADEAAVDPGEPIEIILRRVVPREGRARAFVNDQPVGAATLQALGADLVDIHGQGEDRAICDARGRRAALDAYGGLGGALAETRDRFDVWRAAEGEAVAAEAAAAEAERERDLLAHTLAELTAADPQPGEEATLEAERQRFKTAERIADAMAEARSALAASAGSGALGGATRRLAKAVDGLARDLQGGLAETDRAALDGAVAGLDRCLEAALEAEAALAGASERFAADGKALDAAETRLFQLRGLARKHRVEVDGLAGLLAESRSAVSALEERGAARAAARAGATDAAAAYARSATALSEARGAAAVALDVAISTELPSLRLGQARFRTAVTEAEPGRDGRDQIGFLAAFNPGQGEGAVEKIGSGGELSRLLLALKVALSQPLQGAAEARGPILVFDEIDRGVGGAAADAVGLRLRRLALAGAAGGQDDPPRGQAIVVTHAPQIAARADRHWRIAKRSTAEGASETTRTEVARLSGPARAEEIARMLSGAEITEAARRAAAALIDGSGFETDREAAPSPGLAAKSA